MTLEGESRDARHRKTVKFLKRGGRRTKKEEKEEKELEDRLRQCRLCGRKTTDEDLTVSPAPGYCMVCSQVLH